MVGHLFRERRGGKRSRVAPVEEVAEGAQAGVYVFEHRYPAGAQAGRRALLDRARYARILRRRACPSRSRPAPPPRRGPFRPPRCGGRPRRRTPRCRDLRRDAGSTPGRCCRRRCRTPGVQGVDRRQSRLQLRGDAPQGLFRGPGEGDAQAGRGVDQVSPLAAGVEDSGQAAGGRAAPRRQEFHRSAISFSVPTRATL